MEGIFVIVVALWPFCFEILALHKCLVSIPAVECRVCELSIASRQDGASTAMVSQRWGHQNIAVYFLQKWHSQQL